MVKSKVVCLSARDFTTSLRRLFSEISPYELGLPSFDSLKESLKPSGTFVFTKGYIFIWPEVPTDFFLLEKLLAGSGDLEAFLSGF
jgi:hypothetical protein